MKAIVYDKYGPPDVLHLREVEKPVPSDNEVLIKVHAASINSWDYDSLVGTSILARLISGLWKPKYKILGCDIAGCIEALGQQVKNFHIGDDVFGDNSGGGWGGFAEYVCVKENVLAKKPKTLSFEEASTIPQAGLLALQGLRDVGMIKKYADVQHPQKVLINGAGGGVGTFAIQLAKSHGAEVTGVDRESKFDLMRSLGADHVIDYTKENFTKSGKEYDLILENVATHSMFDYKRALAPNGVFVMVGGTAARIFQLVFLAKLISWTGSRKIRLIGLQYSPKDLSQLAHLVTSNKIKPVIDKCFPLEQTADAFRYYAQGEYKGKVVIQNSTTHK